MESNDGLKVNDNEVPLKTDHNQSDNGLEISRQEESASNLEMDATDGSKITCNDDSETKDEGNGHSVDNKSSADDSRHQYSKEQLIQISKLSSARIRPKCLDNSFNNAQNGLWNPEKWISSRSPAANASNKYNYKKVNDLKERVIEEENEIILSPQRGSFGTGCHVSSNSFGSNRAPNDSRSRDHFSDRNKMDESNDSSHRTNINTRRVGSGRIVAKERDRPNEWVDRNYDRAYEHRDGREGRDNRDNRIEDFSDRRGGRYDRRPNRDGNRNVRYESHRYHKYSRDEEENEPEWFTEGPTSKHDTIELKGFDDDSDSNHNKDIEEKSKVIRNEDLESNVGNQSLSESKEKEAKEAKEAEKELKKSEDFDINAMFKSEDWYLTPENKMISSSSVGISENVTNESDINVKSRSKRWFKESPNQAIGLNTSELSDFSKMNENSLKNRQKESLISSSMTRPSNTHMSNPISPEKIFELLSNGSNRLSIEHMSYQKLDPTKAMSLADIEANLSEMDVNNSEGTDDKRAFDKLLFGLNKKSAQNSNCAERTQTHNEMKNETTSMQTPDAHIIIPKSMRNAPSILELLKEQENKEAMADLHRSNRRVVPNQVIPNHPNGANNVPQNSVNNPMFGTHSVSNAGPNAMEMQNWQNNSHLSKIVRPSRSLTNQEMSDHTSIILQKALQNRQPMGQMVRPQTDIIRANTPNRSVSNFFTPTSVMRNMNSDKDRDSVKSVMPFNDMTPESNSSQYKFLSDNFISKPSPMRPIVKSNNPIGQSVVSKQSPLSPHSDSMAFSANTLAGLQSHLFQQNVQQNQSSVNSYQRPINSPNARPFNLGQSSLNRNSTPSPSALNNIAMNSNQHILQMFNNPNVRTNINQMQMNQMMALQQNSSSDVRQSQYSESRPLTASNVQQMLFNNSKSDPFNSFDRNMMSESEVMKTSVPTTYSQPRLQMQQMYQNSGPSQPNRNSEPRFFGQIFGQEALHHSLPELPTVPLHSALTLDDIERS